MAVPVRLLRSRLCLAMERHAVAASINDSATGYVFEVSLLPAVEEREEATTFITQRRPRNAYTRLTRYLTWGKISYSIGIPTRI